MSSRRRPFPLQGYARHPRRPAERPSRQLRELHRSRLDRLLGGRDGHRTCRLLAFLARMTLRDDAALLEHVRLEGWPDAELEARQDAFSLINNKIVALRETAGLPPFDDPIPGSDAPANVFLKLREILGAQ
jgi:hypothetical protein